MSFSGAKQYLEARGYGDRVMEFPVSSATVAEAARAIQCDEREIVKTLSFMVGDRPILIAVAGDMKIDNSKFKAEFQTKAKMIPFEAVEALIGHGVGGVCPFGIKDAVEVYLDVSMKRFDVIYPACGSANSAVRLSPGELEEVSGYKKWVDVCKSMDGTAAP